MKILFITRHYLDQMLGGPNCSKAFVRAFADISSRMSLIYPDHNNKQTCLSFLNGNKNIDFYPVYDRRSRLKKCIDMYRGQMHRFGHFVKKHLQTNKYDIIIIDHSFTASSGVLESSLLNGAKIITIHHNVERQYIKDNPMNLLYRIPYEFYALKAERISILNSDINLTLTESDRTAFCMAYPQKKNTFHSVGVFEYEDECSIGQSNEERPFFVISGSMDAIQTETSVLRFLKEYMPVLNNICPQAKVVVSGRNPSKLIFLAASHWNNVKIVPNPENLTEEIAKGNYYICPIDTGGGLKLRCMDALRVGLPVLAHKLSTRGYESIMEGGYMFSYSTKEEFAEGLRRILNLKNSHPDVVKCFHMYFSYPAGKMRIERVLESLT